MNQSNFFKDVRQFVSKGDAHQYAVKNGLVKRADRPSDCPSETGKRDLGFFPEVRRRLGISDA